MHESIVDERGVRILGFGETLILDSESTDA